MVNPSAHLWTRIEVTVQLERRDSILSKEVLTHAKPHVALGTLVHPGDIIRMIPTVVNATRDPELNRLRCHMYLYDFLPSLAVGLLDRAPMHLETKENNRFSGTGGVIEWENNFIEWLDCDAPPDDPAEPLPNSGSTTDPTRGMDPGDRRHPLVLEHFKLFFCSTDCSPIGLMRHYTEETPRQQVLQPAPP